ncbi:hypothetical protein ACWC0C_34670 [Streptomyces sp. NPDC001709]
MNLARKLATGVIAAGLATAGLAAATPASATVYNVGSALAGAGTAGATARPGPQLHASKPTTIRPACWSPINIGQPGNVYGWNGNYAGQVEQQYNTCDGTVWAHFQWYGPYQAANRGDTITLVVSSPYGGVYSTPYLFHASGDKDDYAGGLNHGIPNPDAWRAGAQWNQNGCVAWGTLHWYGGQDWSAPTATCGSWVAPS